MENPASLVRRAQLNRQRKKPERAPTPGAAAPVPEPPASAPAPRHTSSHASYTALMRSHDRVSTRHIAPRGGA